MTCPNCGGVMYLDNGGRRCMRCCRWIEGGEMDDGDRPSG